MSPDGVKVQHADRIWIGGQWVGAHSGRTIELVSPNTEEVIGAVAEADAQDMDAAVAAARAAFDGGPWSRLRPPERIAILKRMAQHLHGRTGEIARAWTRADGRARELRRAHDRGLHHGLRADHRRRGEIRVRRDPALAGGEAAPSLRMSPSGSSRRSRPGTPPTESC